MTPDQNADAVPGWVGGFAETNPAFAYQHPDLSSLDMYDNLDHIDLLQRQQKVIWPEFSWETQQGNSDPKRCYQMFAPDISRLGYTNEGRVYSIICPQQGAYSPSLGSMNVEVTVTGQRGWVDETNKSLAADMTVEGKIWFSPSAHQEPLVKLLWSKFANGKLPFPSDKAKAIRVSTHKPGSPNEPIFPLHKGETSEFEVPDFARHPEAWSVGHLGVQIGPLVKTGNSVVDDFNELVMGIFNSASGNMLKFGNVLTWNVWFTAPEHVDTEEWRTHAERWRKSLNSDFGSPEGPGTDARYFDGTVFKPGDDKARKPGERGIDDAPIDAKEELKKEEVDKIEAFLERSII
jgi:hypothetical protein